MEGGRKMLPDFDDVPFRGQKWNDITYFPFQYISHSNKQIKKFIMYI